MFTILCQCYYPRRSGNDFCASTCMSYRLRVVLCVLFNASFVALCVSDLMLTCLG